MNYHEANGFGTPKRNPPPSEETAIRRIGAALFGKHGEKLRTAIKYLQDVQYIDSLDELIEKLSGVNTADINMSFCTPAQTKEYTEYTYVVYTVISQNRLIDRTDKVKQWAFNADLWANVQQRVALKNR